MIYKDCIITHKDSLVTKTYRDLPNNQYHTGIDLTADDVYCPMYGVVIYVSKSDEDNHYSVIIQYSGNISLRFAHLINTNYQVGDLIEKDKIIGKADQYVHFEYLTSEVNDPALRIYCYQNLDLYKHDPTLVLDKIVAFQDYIEEDYVEKESWFRGSDDEMYQFLDDSLKEWIEGSVNPNMPHAILPDFPFTYEERHRGE